MTHGARVAIVLRCLQRGQATPDELHRRLEADGVFPEPMSSAGVALALERLVRAGRATRLGGGVYGARLPAWLVAR